LKGGESAATSQAPASPDEGSPSRKSPTGKRRAFKTAAGHAKDSSPPRESSLQASSFQRITTLYDNLKVAQKVKEEKEARRSARVAEKEERRRKMAERIKEERKLQESIKVKRDALRDTRIKSKREQRDMEAQWEEQRNADEKSHRNAARINVMEAKALDARLDKQEEEQDAKERQEGTEAKQESRSLLLQRRKEMLERKRAVVEAIREATMQGRDQSRQTVESRREAVKKAEHAHQDRLRSQREVNRTRFFDKASKTKLEVVKVRNNIKTERELLYQEKAAHAHKERSNDYLVDEEKARVLEENRQRVARVYSGLYANSEQAQFVKGLRKEIDSLTLVDPINLT